MGKKTKEKNPDLSNEETAGRSGAKPEPTVKDRRPKDSGNSQKKTETENEPSVRVRDKRYWVKDGGGAEKDTESVDLDRKPTYVTQLEKKMEEGDRKLKEYIAAYKQKMVETDEIRARLQKNMEEQADQRFAKLVEKLLPIIDNFSLALNSTQKNQDFQSLRDGVEMIHKQLLEGLSQTGVQPIDSLHQPFDPNLHEAVQIQPVKKKEQDNVVVREMQPGYVYKEKLLRPAKVVVGKFNQSS